MPALGLCNTLGLIGKTCFGMNGKINTTVVLNTLRKLFLFLELCSCWRATCTAAVWTWKYTWLLNELQTSTRFILTYIFKVLLHQQNKIPSNCTFLKNNTPWCIFHQFLSRFRILNGKQLRYKYCLVYISVSHQWAADHFSNCLLLCPITNLGGRVRLISLSWSQEYLPIY